MRTRRVARVIALGFLGGWVACAGSGGPPVEEQMLGLPILSLRSCIGVPASVEADGEVEHQSYEFREVSLADPFRDYRRRNGVRIDPFGRDDEERYVDCEVAVEARDRRVRKVEVVKGVDNAGLRDLRTCRRALIRCLPES